MATLIVDGMRYGLREVPVFLAQFYRLVSDEATGQVTMVTSSPADVRSIRFSHYIQHSAFSELAFDPVPDLQNIDVPLVTLHEIPVISPETFSETATADFPYHFIFIPDELGNLFYTNVGAYKTVFEFLDEKDKTLEIITYRSECVAINAGGSATHGEIVRFLGRIWTKKLDAASGMVSFASTLENTVEVYRTILQRGQAVTGQNQVPIGVERIKPGLIDSPAAFAGSSTEPFRYDFEHIFETQMLPGRGDYVVRFELKHQSGVAIGVTEISLKLT